MQTDTPKVDCAPAWTEAGTHAMSPLATHDEIARFNFLANLNKYMANVVVGGNKVAYDSRAKQAFRNTHGHEPQGRREIRAAMSVDPYYQMRSALRRTAMEMRQQAGRSLGLPQARPLRAPPRPMNPGTKE